MLTDKEKKKDRERSQEFLKYMQYQGYKLHRYAILEVNWYNCSIIFNKIFFVIVFRPNRNGGPTEAEQLAAASTGELRFSYSLLEKLIHYIDRASINMKLLRPSATFSRRSSFKICTRDIKFFSKVHLECFTIAGDVTNCLVFEPNRTKLFGSVKKPN